MKTFIKTFLKLLSVVLIFLICGQAVYANSNSANLRDDDPQETDAIQERFFTGAAANDNSGTSVSSAGDVNGDGYDDVIIGSPNNDGGGSNAGRAYIYFGGMIINSVADVILTGASANDNFGTSVSSAGDVNGDGYDDVIVGAYLNDAGGNNSGRAYIYFGGSNMNNTADVILTGVAADNYFGFSVSGAGDVNGDGFADVVIGAYLNNAGGAGAGRAYLYYGGSAMNNVADVIMTGAAANDNFGYSVSEAGDVNGDGYADIVIGAMLSDAAAVNAGRAYIYFGGASMNNVSDVVFNGSAANDFFGLSVSSAGDVNGDGYSDIICGAPFNDFNGNESGRAYVYFGGPVMNNTSDIIFTGAAANDNFGYSVAAAGDMNGDGFSDLIAGAYGSDAAGTNSGRVYLYNGGSDPDNIADAVFTGDAANDNFGYSVKSAGDMNGDGFSEILAGALNNDAGGSDAGRTYLLMNSLTGTDIADETFTGSAGESMGNSVSSAGDVNGDGYDDIITGSSEYNQAQGKVNLYYGGPSMDNTADVVFTGEASFQGFGYSVSGAGDVNGDGYDDVIISAKYYDSLGVDRGRAYIYLGGQSMNNVVDIVLSGEAPGDRFGTSVSDAGDVNGDGYADVIVGAPESDISASNGGRVYVYFGGANMNSTADIFLNESVTSGFYGSSVSSSGDLNGDGFGDFVVGAPNYTNEGAAFVYFGGEIINNNPDLSIFGQTGNVEFGSSVSGAGDVNGDGFSDLIIGDNQYPAANNAGRAYLYYGGIIMNSVSDVNFSAELNQDNFAYSVSDAGDVNADGYDDILIGAFGNNAGASDAGRAYIYFGSAVVNSTPDVIMTGNVESGNFGLSVSSAGDINGDGYSDVICGAMNDNTGGAQAGRVFLYLSSSPVIQPGIVSVKDIPFDQGGSVAVKWMRSGYDINGQTLITDYLIEKSVPPGISGFSWQSVATVPATRNLSYTYIANTLSDSMNNNNGTTFFRITARTSSVNQHWRSNVISGYSVDNLSPAAPSNLLAARNGSSNDLNWDQNTEPDLHHYIIFRNGAGIATSLNSGYNDAAAQTDSAYDYQTAAVDIHGNISPLSNIASVTNTSGTINLSIIMEGFYNASLNSMNISDTVKIYLRSSSSPYPVIDSSKSVINSGNNTGSFAITNAPSGNYYISVKHRNTIETWSSGEVNYTAGSSVNYSFITSVSQAFGNNMKQVDSSPLRFGIYSGDVSQDGSVDLTDIAMVYNNSSTFAAGYIATDITGDNLTDLTDLVLTYNNSASFVAKVTP
ncbi:MAG TPA: FG-GAP-like repeat-containing protein [Ignavibacteria bacterium]|nr:FG-GAP-like repeat-containing protein [Ignavibacteria bacterium]